MNLPRDFLRQENFELAFWRIAKSTKTDYKQYYRHILPSYSVSLKDNVADLIKDIRRNRYVPSVPTLVFHPKKSGILRPLALLTFRDLIVYQAITNVVASRMRSVQKKFAYKRCFGAILTNGYNEHFFRSWKTAYSAFNDAVRTHHAAGNIYIADFDLVACYELIDHGILRSRIADKVRDNDLMDLLFKCLIQWTTNSVGKHLRHGIPQGPDASCFLAECLLFDFDGMNFNDAKYVRYIDDIKLMAKHEAPLRKALLRLDLKCKEIGLVPQAQKINLGRIEDIESVVKSIPSMVVAKVERGEAGSQAELMKIFRGSMDKSKEGYAVRDETAFKFAIGRLNAKKDVLHRIAPLMNQRPDLSPYLARYLKKFRCSKDASDILLDTLKRDPTYDASAADYIGALDCCEPDDGHREYRRVVNTARNRSEEKSILIRLAALKFKGSRCGPKDAMKMIGDEPDHRVRNMVLHSLFGPNETAPFKLTSCRELLEKEVSGTDEDLSRYCAMLLIMNSIVEESPWLPPPEAHNSVKLLVRGMGFKTRLRPKASVLDTFFRIQGVVVNFSLKRALGPNLRDAEHRSVRLRELEVGDPTARIMMLDTFNEVLVQSFSRSHPVLSAAYLKAAGKNAQPDYGNWVENGTFKQVMGVCAVNLGVIHKARVKADLAHAKSKSGESTKAISHKVANRLMFVSQGIWEALMAEWEKIMK